jgi:hypothetical protein
MNTMKRKSIISMMLLSMMLGMFSTSCQDMLSPNSERHAYTVAQDTLYSYWGILKSLQNIAERYVILNECRGDLVDETSFISDTIGAIVNFGEVEDPEKWKDGACAYLRISDYYHIINSCNAYIAMCDTTRTTGTNQPYMLKEMAQVQAIRAWVYMQLLYAYGPNRVPLYTTPMLTTDDINSFLANKNHELVNPHTLAVALGPDLEKMELIEKEFGMPIYNNYGDVDNGNSHFVCHSSKCMFPVSIVLGDLYLLDNQYENAAQHYYNYINTQYCGPLACAKAFSRGYLDDKLDYPVYDFDDNSIPYNEKNAVSRGTETITCIPSNKGKLEGRVLTDINRLFGFEASMRTYVGEENSSSSVSLSRNYERELIPSKGYETLCDNQNYEIYVGTVASNQFTYETLEVLPGVGDARRSWIYANNGQQWSFRVGDDNLYGKMVSKQNPEGSYSTTYPVIYRKSTVWLRYAEALNRAGFPSYAFAILKSGLCENPLWYPEDPKQALGEYLTTVRIPYASYGHDNNRNYLDYIITDSLFSYRETYTDEEGNIWGRFLATDCSTYAEFEALMTEYFQAEYEASLETETPMEAPRTIDPNSVYFQIPSEDAIGNQPAGNLGVACYYLDRRDLERAATKPFLNFSEQPYLRAQDRQQRIYVKEQGKLLNRETRTESWPTQSYSDLLFTIGVHQRGCGFIRYDDPEDMRSSYNYVDQVTRKIKETTGRDVTTADIYGDSGTDIKADVIDAVEDLIIDECALELAFEGTRFSDLCRVAMRRGMPDYLAERVSKRHTGAVDGTLRAKLNNMANWWLPLPLE